MSIWCKMFMACCTMNVTTNQNQKHKTFKMHFHLNLTIGIKLQPYPKTSFSSSLNTYVVLSIQTFWTTLMFMPKKWSPIFLNGEGAGQWRHQECSQLVPASLQKLHTLEHSYILKPSCAQQVTTHLLNILLDPHSEPLECEWTRFCEKDMSF